ncbi:MAG TPA: DUF2089 domain-containing protein [Chloroflexi bacterium]|nr:DUF2089 domain-containing protein [Chloroflexota bacterium]
MYPTPGTCPICGGNLEITRLHCLHCDTTLEGHFSPGGFLSRLSAEQLAFVETFIRCEGKIKRVEKELGISYPTVRARLEEVIRAMGFEVIGDYADQGGPLPEAERRRILDMLEQGEITTEEALGLLRGEGQE